MKRNKRKRIVLWLLASILSLVGTITAIAAVYIISPDHTFQWDPVTEYTSGEAIEGTVTYEMAISATGVDLNAGGQPLGILDVGAGGAAAGIPEAQVNGLITGRAPGPYLFWFRAVAPSGIASPWSVPVERIYDARVPRVPTNIREKP